MVAERLVFAACPVCKKSRFRVLTTVGEVAAAQRWLSRFHRRRLQPRDGGGDGEALADRAEFTQHYATAICECKRCGQILRNPRPPEARILGAYRDDHYGAARLHSLHRAQHVQSRDKVAWLARHTRGAVRGVEVGSFVGGFLAAAREVGWEITGVDPGREVSDFCRARGLPVLRGRLEELDLAEGSLDLVAIWNTFDQLAAPEGVLAAARRLLRRGGLLVLRVPNGAFYRDATRLAERAPRSVARAVRTALAWNNLVAFPYLHGYTPETLDRLMATADFVRVARRGDTLVTLADGKTRRWAAWEERAVKLGLAALARVAPDAAPWLDVVYERSRGRSVAATMSHP